MAPEGWGRPAAGSRVTANTSTFSTPANGATRSEALPFGSTSKTPAFSGVPPAIAHSW